MSYILLFVYSFTKPGKLVHGETAYKSLEKQTNASEMLKYTFKNSEI